MGFLAGDGLGPKTYQNGFPVGELVGESRDTRMVLTMIHAKKLGLELSGHTSGVLWLRGRP